MQLVKIFYSDLYAKCNVNVENTEAKHFFETKGMKKLDENQKESCEGPLTKAECYKSLKSFKKGKAPGNDGLIAEFYLFFWPYISDMLINSYSSSFSSGEMSASQRQSVITLLEKSGKDRLLIRNWRPISLLNLDYKKAAKSIATRITKVLSKLIHHNHSGFIKGRYTGKSIRIIEDVMEFTKRKDIEGLLISVDFEKAFDSLNLLLT